MAQRVERQAAESLGGVVAENARDIAVRDFVKHDRDDEGNEPHRDGVGQIGVGHGGPFEIRRRRALR